MLFKKTDGHERLTANCALNKIVAKMVFKLNPMDKTKIKATTISTYSTNQTGPKTHAGG